MWNCHGLENPCIENKFVDVVRAKGPFVVFLAETWTDKARLKSVMRKIKFEHLFIALRTNRGGGLILFWRSTINVMVEGLGKNYIDAIINKNQEIEWHFTVFYGKPETPKRVESWNLLKRFDQKF